MQDVRSVRVHHLQRAAGGTHPPTHTTRSHPTHTTRFARPGWSCARRRHVLVLLALAALVACARHWTAWVGWTRANDIDRKALTLDNTALFLADQALKVRRASHFPQVHAALAFVFARSGSTDAVLNTAPFVRRFKSAARNARPSRTKSAAAVEPEAIRRLLEFIQPLGGTRRQTFGCEQSSSAWL